MPNELVELEIDRIDLVDMGANYDLESGEGSHVVLLKRHNEGGKQMAKQKPQPFDLTQFELPEEVQAHIKSLEKQVEDAKQEIETQVTAKAVEFEKKLADVNSQLEEALAKKEDVDSSQEDIWKGVDPKIKELVEKAQADADAAKKEADEARKEARAEAAERRKIEFAKKAEEEYPSLPGDPVEKGAVLALIADRIAENAEDAVAKTLTQLLKSGESAVSSLLTSKGFDGGFETGSAEEEMEKVAAGMVEKGEATNKAQAYAKMAETHPELWERHRQERQ